MAKLPDEQWDMIKDSIDKKNVARSASHRRTHCGKRGGVKMPSDYMTKKELKAMNGEVKSYRMNSPMTYGEFKELPDDLKVMYIKTLRAKYHVPNNVLAEAMKADYLTLCRLLRSLGLGVGKAAGGESKKWHGTLYSLEFMKWWYGPDGKPSIDISEEAKEEVMEEPREGRDEACMPTSGQLDFCGKATDILDSIGAILGNKNVRLHVAWIVEEDLTDSRINHTKED